MRTDQELDDLLKILDKQQTAARQSNLSFTGLEPEHIAELKTSTEIEIASVSWDTFTAPGGSLHCTVQVANPTTSIRTQLGITCFIGPAALGSSYQEMIAWRDASWSMLNSKMFLVEPKKVVLIDMPPIPAAKTMPPGFYMANFILWEQNNYSNPAKIWSRNHIRFEVKP